jgi:hypothetical protein
VNDEQIQAIKSRMERLNTIPWRYVSLGRDELAYVVDNEDHSIIIYDTDEAEPNCIAALDQFDADFIANAPDDMVALLHHIHALEIAHLSRGDKLREALKANTKLQARLEVYRDRAEEFSTALADLRDKALVMTPDNFDLLISDPVEVAQEAIRQIQQLRAACEACEMRETPPKD